MLFEEHVSENTTIIHLSGNKLNISISGDQSCVATLYGSIKHSFGSKFGLKCKQAVLVSAPSIIMQWNPRGREGVGRPSSPLRRGFSMGNFQMKRIDRRKTRGGFVWNRRESRGNFGSPADFLHHMNLLTFEVDSEMIGQKFSNVATRFSEIPSI